MTKQEEMEYRRSCPYDAMGDYSGLFHIQRKKKSRMRTKRKIPDKVSAFM